MLSRIARLSLTAVLLVFCASRPATSQSVTTAQLNGTVKDPSGAALPNATVTVSDPSKGFSRAVTSDSSGNYQILQLPPGIYTVSATSTGFSRLVQPNVTLTVGEQAELPLTLAVGSADASVTVTSNAEIIETERSSQSTTVDQLRIDQPPHQRPQLHQLHPHQLADRSRCRPLRRGDSNLRSQLRRRPRPLQLHQRRWRRRRRLHLRWHPRHRLPGRRPGVPDHHQRLRSRVRPRLGRRRQHRHQIRRTTPPTPPPSASSATATSRPPTPSPTSTSPPTPASRPASPSVAPSNKTAPSTSSAPKSPAAKRPASPSSAPTTSASPASTSPSSSARPPARSSVQGTPQQAAFLTAAPAATPGIQQYIALVGSSSSLALTGQNPAFLAATIGTNRFVDSGQVTPASFVPLNSLIGNFPIQEKTEIYSLRIDHKLTNNQQLLLRGTASPQLRHRHSGVRRQPEPRRKLLLPHRHPALPRLVHPRPAHLPSSARTRSTTPASSSPATPSASATTTPPAATAPLSTSPASPTSAKRPSPSSIASKTSPSSRTTSPSPRPATPSRPASTSATSPSISRRASSTVAATTASPRSTPPTSPPRSPASPASRPSRPTASASPQSFVQGIGHSRTSTTSKSLGAFLQDSWHVHAPHPQLRRPLRRRSVSHPGSPQRHHLHRRAAFGDPRRHPPPGQQRRPPRRPRLRPVGDGKTVLRANYGLFYDRAPGNLESAVHHASTPTPSPWSSSPAARPARPPAPSSPPT